MNLLERKVELSISGFKHNVIYSDLRLEQSMNNHHYFSFLWRYTDAVIIDPFNQEEAIREYIGSDVSFSFLTSKGKRIYSKGIINIIESVEEQGGLMGLYVKGVSPTIFLDDIVKSRIFSSNYLENIVRNVLFEDNMSMYNKELIEVANKMIFKGLTQYNETNFEFLKRLAKRYGQWFYFNGLNYYFGIIKSSGIVLVNGASLHNFKISNRLSSQGISLVGYDYNNASFIEKTAKKTKDGSTDSFASNAGEMQGWMTQSKKNIGGYTSLPKDQHEMDEMVALHTKGKDANSIFYSGNSYIPLKLGQIIDIENKTVNHGLVVIAVTHLSESHTDYVCEFTAIPWDVKAPHYTDVFAYAKALGPQVATIVENNDPLNMGRVKVCYNWNTGYDSDWIRMLHPYAGTGKGFYFIPELGEEVAVGFEENNIERPFVMGTHYNGNQKSGLAHPENKLKGIGTREGHRIEFDEQKDSMGITIKDNGGNNVHLDTKENKLTLNAIEEIELKAKTISLTATDNLYLFGQEKVILHSDKHVDIESFEDMQIKAKETNIKATDLLDIMAKKINLGAEDQLLLSGENTTLNATEKLELKSPDINEVSNTETFPFKERVVKRTIIEEDFNSKKD